MAQKGNRPANGGQGTANGGNSDPVTTQTIIDTKIGCTAVITSRPRLVAAPGDDLDVQVDFDGARITVAGSKDAVELNQAQATQLAHDFQIWKSQSVVFKETAGVPEVDVAATAAKAKILGSLSARTQTKVGNRVKDGDAVPVIVPRTPNNPLEQFCKGPNIS